MPQFSGSSKRRASAALAKAWRCSGSRGQGFHGFDLFADAVEVFHHAVGAFDDIVQRVAAVTQADFVVGLANDQAVGADQAKDAGHEAKAAAAIVRIDQHHFARFCGGELVFAAKPDQVLGEAGAIFGAGGGLADLDRQKAFGAQAGDQVAGGYVGVAVRAAAVRGVGVDGRGGAHDFIVGEGAGVAETVALYLVVAWGELAKYGGRSAAGIYEV